MAVNFRGRVPEITADLAGNYTSLLHFFPAEDFSSPELIRRAVGDARCLRRAVTPQRPLPGLLRSAALSPPRMLCLLSSWATFYGQDLALPGCAFLRHTPLVDTSLLPFANMVVFFRPRAGELELFAMSRSLKEEQLRELGVPPPAAAAAGERSGGLLSRGEMLLLLLLAAGRRG